MPQPAEEDRVVPIPQPDPDFTDPLPIVVAKDGGLVLSYLSFIGNKTAHIIVTFHPAFGHRYGPPGRKGVASHPLAARGLKPDRAFEVKDSSWAREAFGGKGKHYLFTFRDGIFECCAEGYGSETIEEDADVVRLMARRLYR
jgi:hypothetical protein